MLGEYTSYLYTILEVKNMLVNIMVLNNKINLPFIKERENLLGFKRTQQLQRVIRGVVRSDGGYKSCAALHLALDQ